MPLTEHLAEFRTRLIRALIAVAIAFGICWLFAA
jgi:Sec-independent protein secretion pathway component TatC